MASRISPKIKAAIQEYRDCAIALSWIGGSNPDGWVAIKQAYEEAEAAMEKALLNALDNAKAAGRREVYRARSD